MARAGLAGICRLLDSPSDVADFGPLSTAVVKRWVCLETGCGEGREFRRKKKTHLGLNIEEKLGLRALRKGRTYFEVGRRALEVGEHKFYGQSDIS